MTNRISKISIPPSDDVEGLRLSIESSLNRTIETINNSKIISDLSMTGHRITNMRKGVSPNDGVTLKQLKDAFLESSRRPTKRITTSRYPIFIFEINGPVAVGNNVTPHLEMTIGVNELAHPVDAWMNLKSPGAADLIVDIKYSLDFGTATPATRTWTSLFGSSNEITLSAGFDQIYPPKTSFNNPGPFPYGTKFRCDVLSASGSTAVIAVRFKVVGV